MTQEPADPLSASSPYNYEQALPPVARTNAFTQVAPAKKITFYKSGDPQFGGVKMAINQRSFKSFNALMDDLSHRVPLPFGVRTITTPRGIHCISTLDQLEDGGCYLCSDKKYVTPISIGPTGRRAAPQKVGQPASALRRAAQDIKREDNLAALAQQSPRIPKKVTLVKNGDVGTRRPIILNRRNARSFKTLLDEISEIMQFTVKKLYTLDGKRIDNMQALLHCPNVLVCVGREPFKPTVVENPRKPSSEKLPGLPSQSNSRGNVGENHESKKEGRGLDLGWWFGSMNFGLKAKKSVIHPRSALSNRSARFSLSSEKSYPNGLVTSPENGAPCLSHCPHSKAGNLVHSLVNDDIEKRVHVNKDGSLSVEMKVRFRLLNDETLQWSTHIQKSSLRGKVPCEEMGIDEDNGTDPAGRENPEVNSEVDDSLYPCDADSYISNLDVSENEEACCHNCGKPCKDYDIWKNPMHASHKEEPWVKNTWYTHSSCSSTSSHHRVVRKKTASVESSRTSSSGEEYSKHVVRESSCFSETVENRVEYRAVQKCRCRHGQSNTRKRGSPVEMDSAACLANSQNEDNSTATAEQMEGNSSRAGSSGSKSSRCSAESQIKVCEESSSMARTISSCSIKAREEVDLEEASCPSSPKSAYSQSIQRTTPEKRDNPDEPSEDSQPISSFSVEEEADKEQEETSEVHSALENVASNQSVRDEVSECGRCSTERSFRSKACDGNSQREDSNETQVCSVAASSSSRRSKHSHNHREAGAKVSRVSTIKKKRTKRSLHAEDARSSSRASCYSKSSPEMEGREGECHASHDSSSPRSNVSSLSEAAAPPAGNMESASSSSGHCSQSSKSIQEGGQPDSSSKESFPGSSFSNSNGKNGTDKASRPGSVFESTCSKCGCTAATRNKGLGSIQSIVSSRSESKCAETEASGRSEHAGSQSSVAQSSKPRKKKSSLHSNAERSSQALTSESASMYSLHCPAPPKGRPSGKKSRTAVLKKKSNNASAAGSEPTASKEEEEAARSQPTEMEEENGPGDPSEALHNEAGEAEVEGNEDIIPSSLPNASPEEVVHEWLRKIPSETLLMKCEMQDDGDGTELDAEMPSCSNNQELLGEESEGKKEEEEEEEEVAAEEAAEEGAVEEGADEDLNDEAASKAVSEEAKAGQAECNHSVISSQNNHKKDLPTTIQTSVQIMKALLASKQEAKLDRSHSLPEVSPTMGRKLSNSANILITCLASLQILDEELDPSSKSSKCLNRPRYTELLNIFQALWFGCTSEKGGTSSGLQGEAPEKVPSTFKDRKDGDFTPLSSSGVDVSSGDGGSGEGSVAGARDCALSPEKTNGAKPTKEEAKEEAEQEGGCSEEEEEQHSQPCLKSEGEEKAASTGGGDVTETNENQGSDVGEEEEEEDKEVVGEEEMEDVEVEQAEAGDADADPVEQTQEDPAIQEVEGSPSQENANEADEEPSNNQENGDEAAEEPSDDQENVEVAEEPSNDQENGDEAAEEPSDDQENVEAAEEPSDDQENVEVAEEPSDDQENVEVAEEPSNDQENVEAAEEPSDDQENVEVAEEPSNDQENVKEAEEPSDDQENVEAAEEPSDDQENVEAAEEPSDDQENVEAAEEPSNDLENVEEAEEPSNNQENAEEPSNSQAEPNPNTNKSEPQESVEKQLVDESEADTVSSNIVSRQPTAKASLITPQKSIDPDPVWVLKLLKKIEKEFMAHYVSAMNDFKVKWNLPNSEELDLMIAQLKEEVSRRIQKSIEKELGKIRSRAGRRVPRPPDEQLRRDSSILQVENRRRRLQSIHKMSLYNDHSKPRETRELDEELDFFSTTIRDDISDPPGEEEYCPCDACFQKKMEAKALRSRGPVVAANAPIVKAFDLQQILRMQRGKAEEDIAEEEAEGEANEAEAEQEVLADDVEVVEQEVTESEAAEAPADGEEENQNCEEAEGEETVNEEVGGEAQEEAMEEGGEGEEEVEEEAEEEKGEEVEENEEEVEEKGEEEAEEEKGEEVEENEEVEQKGEEEEEVDEEKEEEAEEENGEEEEVEEEKGEEVEEKGEEEAEEKGEEEEEVDEEKEEEAAEEKGEEEAEEMEEVEEKGEEEAEGKGEEEEEGDEEKEEEAAEEKGEEEAEEMEEVEEKGEEEAEEETEDETDGVAADPEAAEGDNEPECATNVDDGEISEAPTEAEEQPPADGEEEDEGDAKPETEVEEAGENEAEANGKGSEPEQDGGSEDPRETEEGATEGAETQRKSSAFSSMGNCSQQSQKGSEEGSGEEEEDCKELEGGGGAGGGDDGETEGDTETKPTKMYPDSEEEEEEEEGEEEEDQASPQAKKKPKTGKSKGGSSPVPKKEASSEAIDQDDLDF
ncbi:retinitis pigmentosa 1-like 1 protein [Podarcis raffonei]|uniref:retinitis pigmentosa 1-like 1 protein n=1 Tax=Podarcis raffonei TaxID=65483 RepID=UPI0023299117|nr:retinitis pigmentosa 1-like 1 protein [Podarcis raffonei]